MESIDGILQHQLATDVAAFDQTLIVLQSLTADHLKPSPHTGKWTTRIKSFLHSREPSHRWIGLCLAEKTSELNLNLMLEQAEVWVGIVLPMLSRADAEPVHVMSMRLLLRVFSSAMHMTEFQRQVSTPNVSRFAATILALAERDASLSLQAAALETLHALLCLYPSILRTVQAPLQKLVLRHVSGSFPNPTPKETLSPASKLLAQLHTLGGKTAGSASWKKTMEAALATSAECLATLRSTFETLTPSVNAGFEIAKLPGDPMIAVPLAMDRLRCMTAVITALLRATTSRAISVPLASMVQVAMDLLKTAREHPLDGQNAALYAFQISLIPSTVDLGCRLVTVMCESFAQHLTPYAAQLLNALVYQLSQPNTSPSARTSIFRALTITLFQTHVSHSPTLPNRIARSTLDSITILLSDDASQANPSNVENGPVSGSRGKGKKRARGYEGDELLKIKPSGPYLAVAQTEEIIAAVDVLEALVLSGMLSQPTLSTIHRVSLSLLLLLSQQNPHTFSSNPSAHGTFHQKVLHLTSMIVQRGKDGFIARSLGTVLLATSVVSVGAGDRKVYIETENRLESALHPRLPPLLKTTPAVEHFPLSREEETKEEKDIREELHLVYTNPVAAPVSSPPQGFANATTAAADANTPMSLSFAPASATFPQLERSLDAQTTPPTEPNVRPISVSSLAPSAAVHGLGISSDSTTNETESEKRAQTYEVPQWAVPSAPTSTDPPQAPRDPLFESSFSTSRDDDDDDQPIPEIDMRSDTDED